MQEKENRKGIVEELAHQHEIVDSLIEIGPSYLSGPPSGGNELSKKLEYTQAALDHANKEKELYQAALEQAEENLVQQEYSNYYNDPSLDGLSAATALPGILEFQERKSSRDGLSEVSKAILTDEN